MQKNQDIESINYKNNLTSSMPTDFAILQGVEYSNNGANYLVVNNSLYSVFNSESLKCEKLSVQKHSLKSIGVRLSTKNMQYDINNKKESNAIAKLLMGYPNYHIEEDFYNFYNQILNSLENEPFIDDSYCLFYPQTVIEFPSDIKQKYVSTLEFKPRKNIFSKEITYKIVEINGINYLEVFNETGHDVTLSNGKTYHNNERVLIQFEEVKWTSNDKELVSEKVLCSTSLNSPKEDINSFIQNDLYSQMISKQKRKNKQVKSNLADLIKSIHLDTYYYYFEDNRFNKEFERILSSFYKETMNSKSNDIYKKLIEDLKGLKQEVDVFFEENKKSISILELILSIEKLEKVQLDSQFFERIEKQKDFLDFLETFKQEELSKIRKYILDPPVSTILKYESEEEFLKYFDSRLNSFVNPAKKEYLIKIKASISDYSSKLNTLFGMMDIGKNRIGNLVYEKEYRNIQWLVWHHVDKDYREVFDKRLEEINSFYCDDSNEMNIPEKVTFCLIELKRMEYNIQELIDSHKEGKKRVLLQKSFIDDKE